jgi:hypothetical protein
MSADDTFERRVQVKLLHLHAEEDEKRRLHDRAIGGENVPRPSREFIERCVGPLRSDDELQKLARDLVERDQRQAWAEARRKEEVQRSLRERSRQIEARKKESKEKDQGRDR